MVVWASIGRPRRRGGNGCGRRARETIGPTPGCVISRPASWLSSAALRTDSSNGRICLSNPSSNPSRSARRCAYQPGNGSASISPRRRGDHTLGLNNPSSLAIESSWFFTLVRIRPPRPPPAAPRRPPPRGGGGAPPPLGTQQPFVLGHRVQLVLHPGAHPHQATAVHQQLPQLLVVHRRLPDCRKSILHQQRQNVPGIPLVGLLLAWTAGADRACIPYQKLVPQVLHQVPEPTEVPRGLGT